MQVTTAMTTHVLLGAAQSYIYLSLNPAPTPTPASTLTPTLKLTLTVVVDLVLNYQLLTAD